MSDVAKKLTVGDSPEETPRRHAEKNLPDIVLDRVDPLPTRTRK
jgi:hypothetical protein